MNDTDPIFTNLIEPPLQAPQSFTNAAEAVDAIEALYAQATDFLCQHFTDYHAGKPPEGHYRACYPQLSITTFTYTQVDTRLAFGHVGEPGTYTTTLTRPKLFRNYLLQQIELLIENHQVPVTISISDVPIPLHFALTDELRLAEGENRADARPLRDIFDVPDLKTTNDDIANGDAEPDADGIRPLAPFTAQRIDYSLARLAHYTATDPAHFQNHILFTNYGFYMDEFVDFAMNALKDPTSGYTSFVASGNCIATPENPVVTETTKQPQMPTYHLTRADGGGITLVNIGVGPSNAKTATDHIAVLRPHAWLMLGHCAGLRNSQSLGDYVLAHAYVREDSVLDADLPVWVPVPALAEIQIALEKAVAEVTKLEGFALKKVMRTGTVASVDNRNWELREHSGPVARLSQSRAIALDMESATIAANGFRFRVPYGTLLCVSDKPLHGELKLPGMASEFYRTQVASHLQIGIKAMETLREMPLERLHSRKLRSFDETAFL
ncbi:AMP nucleosidase [Amylibacter sp. IMCC11727]|uniref:AMP nucleosidase n=1 Tax=Amylibacter sp. IMCC11727 TaxID=3039851 RepID=UPI00244E5053|nr:AMP nucleosidase [Amylibacter sp. IMCC11727]WGI21708.1 AMP nucleosidase [Amylibacter sp. IMCC11727]